MEMMKSPSDHQDISGLGFDVTGCRSFSSGFGVNGSTLPVRRSSPSPFV